MTSPSLAQSELTLEHVSVSFPIYQGGSRSLKKVSFSEALEATLQVMQASVSSWKLCAMFHCNFRLAIALRWLDQTEPERQRSSASWPGSTNRWQVS